MRAGYRAAVVRLGLADDSLGSLRPARQIRASTVATARAAEHTRLGRGSARALGPSGGAEREDDDERRSASEQQFHNPR